MVNYYNLNQRFQDRDFLKGMSKSIHKKLKIQIAFIEVKKGDQLLVGFWCGISSNVVFICISSLNGTLRELLLLHYYLNSYKYLYKGDLIYYKINEFTT